MAPRIKTLRTVTTNTESLHRAVKLGITDQIVTLMKDGWSVNIDAHGTAGIINEADPDKWKERHVVDAFLYRDGKGPEWKMRIQEGPERSYRCFEGVRRALKRAVDLNWENGCPNFEPKKK